MKIAFDFVATQKGSGTKSYIINFCNKIHKIDSKYELHVYICENYLKEVDEKFKKFIKRKVYSQAKLSNKYII